MSTQTATPVQKRASRVTLRTTLLVALAVILTAFAFKNWTRVDVWPIGPTSLTVVIVIAFVLGALIGWLAKSLSTHSKT